MQKECTDCCSGAREGEMESLRPPLTAYKQPALLKLFPITTHGRDYGPHLSISLFWGPIFCILGGRQWGLRAFNWVGWICPVRVCKNAQERRSCGWLGKGIVQRGKRNIIFVALMKTNLFVFGGGPGLPHTLTVKEIINKEERGEEGGGEIKKIKARQSKGRRGWGSVGFVLS